MEVADVGNNRGGFCSVVVYFRRDISVYWGLVGLVRMWSGTGGVVVGSSTMGLCGWSFYVRVGNFDRSSCGGSGGWQL